MRQNELNYTEALVSLRDQFPQAQGRPGDEENKPEIYFDGPKDDYFRVVFVGADMICFGHKAPKGYFEDAYAPYSLIQLADKLHKFYAD